MVSELAYVIIHTFFFRDEGYGFMVMVTVMVRVRVCYRGRVRGSIIHITF